MYIITIPDDPTERIEYMLEQMRVCIDIQQSSEEQQQVEIIFNALLNVMSEQNYKVLANTLCNTSKRLSALRGKNIYWSEFLRYMHWKLTGHLD
uniref:Uncharacterized protein n=1 Tax=Marseillevirus LCMAC202 TaxID=2506606 RepID=A0A481YX74_9VIRU|nr:MAG: hypothetical protein LCMAC202_01040 [Marseillevirus LCMAC202]